MIKTHNVMYKGQLKDFPKEIVEKMLERQVEQGNKRDVTVFECLINRSHSNGGFDWEITTEGGSFWADVLMDKDFNLFFKIYPKEEFALPEKWYVVVTEESKDLLTKFKQSTQWTTPAYQWYAVSSDGVGWGEEALRGHTQFIEITFEKFKKYVMKGKELTFPRMMLVRDNNYQDWKEKEVHACVSTLEHPWIAQIGWKYAKEIPVKSPREIELEKLESQIEELKQQAQRLREV